MCTYMHLTWQTLTMASGVRPAKRVLHMTVSIENATPQPTESTKSRNSYFLVRIQIKPKTHFEFVPRDTKKSDFLGFADLGYAVCCSVLQQFQWKLSYIHALGIRIYTFRLHIYYMCIQIDVNICVWHVYIHF